MGKQEDVLRSNYSIQHSINESHRSEMMNDSKHQQFKNHQDDSSFFFGHIIDKNIIPDQSKLKVQQEEDPTNQVTAKNFLQAQVFPSLDQGIQMLLSAIKDNGEFDKYVEKLAEKQEALQKEMRKREKDRRKLEQGENYISSSEDSEDVESSESDDSSDSDEDEDQYGEEEDYDEEDNFSVRKANRQGQRIVSDPSSFPNDDDYEYNFDSPSPDGKMRVRGKSTSKKSRHGQDTLLKPFRVEEHFNPLRFLGMTLKDLNEQLKARLASQQSNQR